MAKAFEKEIAVLRRRLIDLDCQRVALVKSITALEESDGIVHRERSQNGSTHQREIFAEGVGRNGGKATSLQAAVLESLSDKQSKPAISTFLNSSYPQLAVGLGERSLETALYKLQKKKLVRAIKRPGKPTEYERIPEEKGTEKN